MHSNADPAIVVRVTGVVHVDVVAPAGDPRSGGLQSQTPSLRGDSLTVTDVSGATVAHAISGALGADVSLPVGVYAIREGICGISAGARVIANATTHITMSLPDSC